MTRFCSEAKPPPDTRSTADVLKEQIKLIRYTLFHVSAEDRSPEVLFRDDAWIANLVARFNTRNPDILKGVT